MPFPPAQINNIPHIEVIPDSIRRAEFMDTVEKITNTPIKDTLESVLHYVINIGLKVLGAALVFIIGRWLIRRVHKSIHRMFERRGIDPSLRSFLTSAVQGVMIIFLLLMIIGIFGIRSTSLFALFGAAGLAIGMALSGTLQNFAGGVLVLALKPYKIGDYVEMQGQSGTVQDIRIFNTVLNTPDNKTIIIPNGAISTGIINNYSRAPLRRVEWTFGIDYGDEYDKVHTVLTELVKSDKRVLDNPAPFVALQSLGDSSVNIVVRAWVASADFWNVYFDMNELVYKRFLKEGITIPFPQMDVRLTQVERDPAPQKKIIVPDAEETIECHHTDVGSNQVVHPEECEVAEPDSPVASDPESPHAREAQNAPGDGPSGGAN